MIYSMTAFARVQNQFHQILLCWELRSVNHRYLDASFRLPESYRASEPALRKLLREKVSRGKIECQLRIQGALEEGMSLVVNRSRVKSLLQASQELQHEFQLADDLKLSQVLAWPGVIDFTDIEQDSLSAQVEQSFTQALTQLVVIRRAEGNALQSFLAGRLVKLQEEIQRARALISSINEHTKAKLVHRLHALELVVQEARIEQEIALMLSRLDVSEELDRLDTHCAEVNRALASEEASGRRLDFLMQELNREANTLSSKSDTVVLTQCAVEMKVLIEQMREQIQNIE
jgi:uncharacterized protein (TIGR00255 family)